MAKFVCKVIGSTGKQIQYVEEASTKAELLNHFHEKNIYCIEIKEVENRKKIIRHVLTMKELMTFCKQMGAMLTAGISISAALDTLYTSVNNKKLRDVVMQLYERILSGQSVSQSMLEMEDCFPDMLIYMVEVGENSGNLDKILKNMAEYYEKEFKIRKKVQNAMIYPVILSFVSIAVVSFLLVFVVPSFISMYAEIELPLPTRMLLSMSNFLINNFSTLIIIAVALGIFVLWMSINETVRYHFGRLQLKAPMIGNLLTVVMTSRFCSTFSVLLKSGIGIMKSLDITAKAMDSTFLEAKLREIMDNVRKGKQFSAALSKEKIFDKMMVAMVVAGEETGSLDQLMSETGVFFEVQADEAATKLITFIEPVMIVVFGFVVAFIVLSIILPMFSMYQQMM